MSNAMQDYLTQAAQRLRLSVDAQSGILFGNQGGMNMLLTRGTSNQNYVSLVFSLTRGGQEPDGAELKSFVKGNKLVANCTVRRSRVGISPKRRPVGFIFVGPTGVGKTEGAFRQHERY